MTTVKHSCGPSALRSACNLQGKCAEVIDANKIVLSKLWTVGRHRRAYPGAGGSLPTNETSVGELVTAWNCEQRRLSEQREKSTSSRTFTLLEVLNVDA